MPAPNDRIFARWILDQLWDNTGSAREGFWGWPRRGWKLIVAALVSAVLDRMEWVEHHPPDMVFIALIHFALVLIAISLCLNIARLLSRSGKRSPSK